MSKDPEKTVPLDKIASLLGASNFNRLASSVSETLQKRRFRHWQEILLAQIEAGTGVLISSVDQFANLFRNADSVRIPISRDDFISDANVFFLQSACDT